MKNIVNNVKRWYYLLFFMHVFSLLWRLTFRPSKLWLNTKIQILMATWYCEFFDQFHHFIMFSSEKNGRYGYKITSYSVIFVHTSSLLWWMTFYKGQKFEYFWLLCGEIFYQLPSILLSRKYLSSELVCYQDDVVVFCFLLCVPSHYYEELLLDPQYFD